MLCLLLCGCKGNNQAMDSVLEFRTALTKAAGCSFDAHITADYGEQTYTFAMGCKFNAHGDLQFVVAQPESIAGISGTIDSNGGSLTFDDTVLAFPLLAGERLSPVSAPWLFMKAFRSGFIVSAGQEDVHLRFIVEDNYLESSFVSNILLNSAGAPEGCEIFWNGRRILDITVENFQIL